jgi:RNA polymerase sigma-70 factor, ECF subfamily
MHVSSNSFDIVAPLLPTRIAPVLLEEQPREDSQVLRAVVSDGELLRRIAAGDKLAMGYFFSRHQLRVFKFLLRKVGNDSIAEEIVGDVFLDVWRQAGAFEGRAAVTTWLLGIARLKAADVVRKRKEIALDIDAAELIADPADDPEVTLQKSDRAEVIRHCLSKLSARHEQIIELVYYEGKSVKEVSKLVGISMPTVKSRMFYARRRLAEMMPAA